MNEKDIKQPIIIGSKKGGGGGAKEANDTLFARHQAAVLDVLSEGEIVGLVDGASSIFFNETRLFDKQTGEANFRGVKSIQRYGTQDQTIPSEFLADFSSSSITEDFSGNGKLELNTPQYLKITTGNIERALTDYLKVSVFTDAMYKMDKEGDNAGDTLGTKVSFNIDFIYYNASGKNTVAVHRTGFDGKCGSKYVHTFGIDTEQYQPFTDWEVKVTRVGGETSSSGYKVFNNIYCGILESQITDKLEYPLSAYVGVSLDAEAFGTSIPTRAYDVRGVKISVPTNYFPPDATARTLTLANASNFAVGDSVSTKFSISSITSSDTVDDGYKTQATAAISHGVPVGETFTLTISGASQSEYNGDFTCTANSATGFYYYMDSDPDTDAATGTLVATAGLGTVQSKSSNTIVVRDTNRRFILNSTIYDTNNHTGNSSTISAISTDTDGINYASYTRHVSNGTNESTEQTWDGNFYTAWTNNPAWIYYDLLTNKRYGLGNYISSSDIDKWELYAIARYCDEMVKDPTDSTGNTEEPRFTCNLYLTKATEAYKVLQDLTATFRGMQYWMNGSIIATQDREKDPVYQFTDANVIGGKFSYEGTSRRTRHNMAKVTYNNPDNFYKQTIEYVQDNELLAKEGSYPKVKNISAFGCTSRGQALRLGKWALASEKLNTETVTFSTGLNASFLRPGDVINVQDARRQGASWSGRVLKPSGSSDLVTNGNFGSGITGWTQGTATQAHDTTNNRIKLTSGGTAQTPRSYQSLGTLTANKTYRVKARAFCAQAMDSDQYAQINITTSSDNTGALTATGTYRLRSQTETFLDFTVTVGGSNAAHYIQLVGINLDNTENVSFDSIEVYEVNTTTSVRIDRSVDIASGKAYNLTLTKPGYIAKLAQDSATISSTSYSRGDIISSITTQEASQQLRDDSNNLVMIDWSPYVYAETKVVNNSAATGVSTLTVSSAFSVVPDDETIWILQRTTEADELKAQQYTVLAVTEGEENTLNINALKYNASKFDYVDKLEPIEEVRTINMPSGDHVIPPPTNLIMLPAGEAGPAGTVQDILTISWSPPKVNTSGVYDAATTSNNTVPYQFTKGYEVMYRTNSDSTNDWHTLGVVTANTVDIVQPRADTYNFKIRTVNMLNMMSTPLEASFAITPSAGIAKQETSVSQVNTGGVINTSVTLSTSNVTFGTTTPTVTNVVGAIKTAASNPGTLAFAGLANDGVGYVYWDHSAGTITAKVRNLTNKTWYTLGGSEWTSISTDTVACTAGSEDHKITGTNTTFTSDYSVGSLIRVNDTDAETYEVAKIDSDTVLYTVEPIVVTRTASAIKKQSFVPDFVNDVILATITEDDDGDAWTMELHAVEAGVEGADGQGIKTVQLFKLNDSSFGTSSAGTYASPTDSVEAGWTTTQPALSADDDKVYMVSRTFTSDGASPQDANWSSPVIVAQRTDGTGGENAKKSSAGQLFYQSESASAPSAPSNSGVTFTFATGAMSGGVIGTGSTNWNVTPPTASGGATTSKIWYVYYTAVETSAGGGTATPTFDSTVKQGTGFTNLVTFSSGNFQQNGSNITTIDGGNITTGTIAAARIGAGSFTTTGGSVGGWTINSTSIYTGTEDHSGYTANTGDVTLYSDGTDSSFHAYQFYIDTGGNAYFKGDLTGSSGTFSGTLQVGGTSLTTSNTFNDQTNWSDVAGTPNAPANNATNTNAPESANHSSGSVGGWTISASKIYSTYVEIDNTNHRILIKDS